MDWTELYRKIDIQHLNGRMPVSKPNGTVLADYEQRTGFRLPESYKSFLKVFGPGCLSDFNILSPTYPSLVGLEDLEGLNAEFQEGLAQAPEWLIDNFLDPERVSRLIIFAKNSGGDYAGWDPLDIRDLQKSEYGIYLLLGDFDSTIFAAETFSEFVSECCFGLRFREIVGDTSMDLPPQIFAPDSKLKGS